MEKTFSMTAVAFQEGDVWVVQGIQYNLVAMARNVQDIPVAFMNALCERVFVAGHLGLEPFDDLGPTPDRFHKMYEAAKTEVKLAETMGQRSPTVRLAALEAQAA